MLAKRAGWRGAIHRGVGAQPKRKGYAGVFDRIRGKTTQTPDDDMPAILARLSETPDGDAFLTWIHQQTRLPTSEDAPEGALRAAATLNRFATRIFALLDRGLTRDAGA